jgi:hypothetical protein
MLARAEIKLSDSQVRIWISALGGVSAFAGTASQHGAASVGRNIA